MMEKLLNQEGQEDLRIVEHLDMHKLPDSIQHMLSLATTPEEQDILLLSTLTAMSACVPNVFFRYGPTGKNIEKQDDNMTIWQFDDNTQNAINQNVIAEIVKLPNCHDKFFVGWYPT